MDDSKLWRGVPNTLRSTKHPVDKVGPSAFRPRPCDHKLLSCDNGALCSPQDTFHRCSDTYGVWSLDKGLLDTEHPSQTFTYPGLPCYPDPINDPINTRNANAAHALIVFPSDQKQVEKCAHRLSMISIKAC
jgi:hypothetical protein